MNKWLYFASGIVVGAVGTYIFLKDSFNSALNEEINELSNYYDGKLTDIEEKYTNKYENFAEDHAKEPIKKVLEKQCSVDEDEPDYDEIINKLNYNQFSTKTKEERSNNKKPYIISNEEYANDNDFEKCIVSYFSEDEVAMDSETEEVIDDVNNVLGFINLEDFGQNNEIYIRNEKLGIDYQVILETSSYQDFLDEEF